MTVRLELYIKGRLRGSKHIQLVNPHNVTKENAFTMRQLQLEHERNIFMIKNIDLIKNNDDDYFIEAIFLSEIRNVEISASEMKDFENAIRENIYKKYAIK